jgi:hypothetical protein
MDTHLDTRGEDVPIEKRKVAGLTGLLQETLEICRTLPEGAFLWFRGLSRGQYELLPKIMRDGRTADEVFERELRLLTRFRQRSLAYWPEGYPQSDWEHLFAMQHFGLPTRLLDWSENLFVAAYFALMAPDGPIPADAGLPSVWCIDPVAWNRATPVLSGFGDSIHVLTTSDDEMEAYRPETNRRRNKSPVAMFGTHNSKRIVAQRGTFIVWGNEVKALEACAEESQNTLWKLEIEGNRGDLSRELTAIGFGETMVFPELTSLATELTRTVGWRT